MFILELLQGWTWLLYVIALLGAFAFSITFFGSKIPYIGEYASAAQIISVFLLVVSVYFIGADAEHDAWQSKVDKLENDMLVLKNTQQVVNEIIVEKYVDRPIEVITKHTETIIQKIPQVITKEVDAKCIIPNTVIELHNEAALEPYGAF